MSDYRTDHLTGRRVIIAEHRAGRPNEYAARSSQKDDSTDYHPQCPFCQGNEHITPIERYALRDESGNWRVRVVPNKYPAVGHEGGSGMHEVIIESPRHCRRTGQLSEDELADVLQVYARRLRAAAEAGLPYRLIFKNVGPSAGASMEHLHSQLLALPEVPPAAAAERRLAAEYYSQTGRQGWSDRIAAERQGERLIMEHEDWVAFCPAAARQPYETWIMPIAHQSDFEAILDSPAEIERLASLVYAVILVVEAEIDGEGYNVMVHTGDDPQTGHWRIEIVPRVSSIAGLELATGLFVNVLSPERAAERLRNRIGSLETVSQ